MRTVMNRAALRLVALAFVLPAGGLVAAAPPSSGGSAAPSSVLEIATSAGAPLKIRRGAFAPASALAFSPDGRRLASGGYGEVLLWDVAAGRIGSRAGAGKIAGQVRAVVFVDAGTLAVAAGGEGPVLLDAATGAVKPALKETLGDVVSLARGEGGLIAAGSAGGKVRVWKGGGDPVARIDVPGSAVDLAFSPDGGLLAVATGDRQLKLYRTGDWGQERWFPLDGPPTAVAFSPGDGSSLITCVGGPTGRGVRIRVKSTEEPTTKAARKAAAATPAEPYASPPRKVDLGGGLPIAAAFHPANGRLYVALADHTVRVVTSGGSVANTLRGHAESVSAVAVDPEGLLVATAGAEGAVKLWDARKDALLATLVPLAQGTGGWLVATPKGEFDASDAAVVVADDAAKRTPAPEAVHRALESVRPAKPAPAARPAEVKKAERPGRKKLH
ncbi:WD40 repeat domain-containing protein [Paludisphaera rhizosphaerae]|uniref:WD40 repeat domain-containing protein n=1 Tax=Paludisphaera rhizosphaerae TaxID=2711216 RepID=UPI0013EB408C|nr:hypothetical protein [Paludisphaera rhizosphaerae]